MRSRKSTFAGSVAVAVACAALAVLAAPLPARQDAPRSLKATTRPVASALSQTLRSPLKAYGSSSAPIKLEMFTDYECPSCRAFFEQTLKPLINDYVASGKVYLVHHDFPLQMHKYGYEAARWANAAAEAGQFATVEAALYDNQEAWANSGDIAKYISASMPGDDFKRVEKYMQGCESEQTAAEAQEALRAGGSVSGDTCPLDAFINADHALGMTIPVQATPTYQISYKGKKLPAASGVVSWPILKQFFDSLLAQQ